MRRSSVCQRPDLHLSTSLALPAHSRGGQWPGLSAQGTLRLSPRFFCQDLQILTLFTGEHPTQTDQLVTYQLAFVPRKAVRTRDALQ